MKILIAEDDLESLKLIGLILESKGYEIIAARNGDLAIEKTLNQMPDLIILDIMMPGMDGYEVCRHLRANPKTEHIPIMMFTAKTQVADKVAGFEAGADEYLTKPIHPTELVTRVEALLSRTTRLAAAVEPSRRAKVVGFLGCKGGVGTSTLVVNVGVSLSLGPSEDGKVMVLDLGSGISTLYPQLGFQSSGRLGELLSRPVDQLSSKAILAKTDQHTSGLLVLGGVSDPVGLVPSLEGAQAEAVVRHLGDAVDYLLIDMRADLDEVNQAVLPLLDKVMVVVEPQRIAVKLTEEMLGGLEQLEVPQHQIGVVLLQRAPSATSLTKGRIEELLDREVANVIPPAPEVAFQASDRGQPMVVVRPDSLVAAQLNNLAESVASE